MVTNRTPIDRDIHIPITPRALEAFGHMQQLKHQCSCLPDAFTDTRCDACQEWWKWHLVLSDEVQAKPWEFPCILEPNDNNHHDPATMWDRRAQQRYRIFDDTLRRTATSS